MKKTRTIRRVYITKSGKRKVYEYKYTVYQVKGHKRHRGKKNILWRGKITKYGEKWLEEYKKGLDFSDRNDLEARILSDERNGRTVSVTTMESRMKETKTERYIYNMGGDAQDIADELGVEYEDIVNDDHWDWSTNRLTINGVTYEFTFDYKNHTLDWRLVE